VNHDYLGLRRLDLGPNGNLSNPVYDRFSTSPREVAGLLASGEVFVPDYLDGLLAAEVDNGSIQERTLDSASTIRDGDVSPSGTRIAVTLMRRGIALVEIDGSGSVLQRNEVQLTPEYVREVQWISEEMLAVVLYDGRVLFTEIGSDLSTRVRSQWVPSPAADFAVADAEARNNRLALLFGDGRLIVLDVSNIPETESDSWHLR
jgi:hypothetical protein